MKNTLSIILPAAIAYFIALVLIAVGIEALSPRSRDDRFRIPSGINASFDPTQYSTDHVIQRDVAVMGGGPAGTYAAINFQIQNQSVVLIEASSALGGQVNTYTDPATGISIDYGVQEFLNISIVRDFFAYFNIPLITPEAPSGSASTRYADFRTGDPLNIQPGTNFTPYVEQLNKYPYLEVGWNLPYPVPEDLLLPFSEFIEKYGLQDIAYAIYFASQGLADVLTQITALVFKAVDQQFIGILAGNGVTTARHNNIQLFQLAQSKLGSDALVSSTVVGVQRPDQDGGVRLCVQTPEGMKLIMASKLLIAMPPLLSNMAPFDLDQTETNVFSQWTYSAYYTMLVNNTGLVAGGRYANAISDPSTYNIPDLPAAYQVTETAVQGLYYIWYASSYILDEDTIQANVILVIELLRAAEESTFTSIPNFVAFKSHTPYRLSVSADAIQNGFYREFNALQGYRNTWYTGSAVTSTGSTGIWNFTASLIPQIIAA